MGTKQKMEERKGRSIGLDATREAMDIKKNRVKRASGEADTL